MSKIFSSLKKVRELSSLLFLVGMFLIVGIINPDFLSPSNLITCFNGSVMYILLAVGIAFVLMTGQIDVSIGSTLGLCAAFAATCVRDGRSLFFTIPVTLLIGAAIGLFNGFVVAKLKIPSIILTLGTMGIIRGIIYIYTNGAWIENLPDQFKQYSQAALGPVNIFLLIAVIIVAGIHFYITKTKSGRYFKALGDNIGGATLIGIPILRTQILAYVFCGISAALASLVFVSRIGFVSPTAGTGYEMTAIAACVLGGISLSGGVGSVVGASIGAIIMASLSRVLVFMKFSSDWDNTITGILLITIVVFDAVMQRRAAEKARRIRLSARTLSVGEVSE